MKYLVVSDNHGDREILVDLVSKYRGEVDRMFHCGDSELSPSDDLWQEFLVVKGNCDYYDDFPTSIVEKTVEDIVFMTHGHLTNVRFDLTPLSLKAHEKKATIVLFGHTHEIGCEMRENILFLNPGSIRLPRGPLQYESYAIIESTPDEYRIQYYTRDDQPIEKLHFLFKKPYSYK